MTKEKLVVVEKEVIKPKNYILGALVSPKDKRDWIYEKMVHANVSIQKRLKNKKKKTKDLVVKSLPPKLDLVPQLKGIYDQGVMPLCAAVVAACCKEWQERKFTNNTSFSPMFVYNQRSNKPGEGMFGRNVMEILSKSGCCRSSFYRSDIFNLNSSIDEEAYKDGKNYLITGYARVTTLEGLKEALVLFGPCYISFNVYNYDSQFWHKTSPNQTSLGGHAVTVVGYDDVKQAFRLRNSWGYFWGEGGYTWFPYSQFSEHSEIWSMVDGVSPLVPPPEPGCNCTLL